MVGIIIHSSILVIKASSANKTEGMVFIPPPYLVLYFLHQFAYNPWLEEVFIFLSIGKDKNIKFNSAEKIFNNHFLAGDFEFFIEQHALQFRFDSNCIINNYYILNLRSQTICFEHIWPQLMIDIHTPLIILISRKFFIYGRWNIMPGHKLFHKVFACLQLSSYFFGTDDKPMWLMESYLRQRNHEFHWPEDLRVPQRPFQSTAPTQSFSLRQNYWVSEKHWHLPMIFQHLWDI